MHRSLLSLAVMLALGGAATVDAQAQSPAPRPADTAPGGDEELALAALEGLMSQPPERALPIIKRVLAGSQTALVKRRALFVLSQIDSAEARQMLTQQSRSSDPGLRREAIRSIGIGGDPASLEGLLELYKSGAEDLKREVLEAWLIAERKDLVYQAALAARTEEEANRAIRTLGAMGATEELRKLGDQPKAASGLLEAYAISGDLASLRKVAESHPDRAVRLEAVRKMGIVNGESANTALRDIYQRSTDADIRDAALQGLLISGDDKAVLALYRAAKTQDERRALLRTLSMMDGEAALEAIDAALAEKSAGERK